MNMSTIGTNNAIKITIQYSTLSAPQYLQSKLYDLLKCNTQYAMCFLGTS
jgi:hypothetical protein